MARSDLSALIRHVCTILADPEAMPPATVLPDSASASGVGRAHVWRTHAATPHSTSAAHRRGKSQRKSAPVGVRNR